MSEFRNDAPRPIDSTVEDTLDRVLAERWSCRGFHPDPLSMDVIKGMLRAASRTPSWCNTQPWHVHVISGATLDLLRARVRDHFAASAAMRPDVPFPLRYEGEFLTRRRATGWALYEAVGVAKGDRVASEREAMRNFDFFGAPHLAVVTATSSLGPYGAIDCGLFAQSFMLAAQARGIATVTQASVANIAPVVRAALDVPDDRHILFGISFGRPDLAHPANAFRTKRQELDEMVTWHR